MVISLNPHQLSDACAFLSPYFTEKDTEAGSGLRLVCTAQAGGKAPVEPLAMASAAMVMVPCVLMVTSQTMDGSVALVDKSVGRWSFSSWRG